MTEWETALIIGQFALPIFLLYATTTLDRESKTYVPLKAFLFITAFFLMLNIPSTLQTMIDANNAEDKANFTTDQYGNLTAKITTSFTTWTWINYTVIAYVFFAFVYWLFIVFRDIATGKKRYEGEGEGEGFG